MKNSEFGHSHAAHCESGVMSSMMSNKGLKISEAMAFGCSQAMAFAYLPWIKIGGMPLIAYRMRPKAIINGLRKSFGLKMKQFTFGRNIKAGQMKLDELLEEGKLVGAQTSVYWLDYFPQSMRFHFNAHNLLVYGKENGEYLVSDPVFDVPKRCSVDSMSTARFAKGIMAPKGLLYYIEETPKEIEMEKIIKNSIKKTSRVMVKTPVPVAGIKSIKWLSKDIRKLKAKDKRYAKLFLGHIVRMQEEIGTGGAGFRFLYASFLQEAGELIGDRRFEEAALLLMAVGDKWREFALAITKAIRSKKSEEIDFDAIANLLDRIAIDEKEVYELLLKIV